MVVNRMRAWRRQGYTGIEESNDPEPHRLSNPEQYTNDNLLPLINPGKMALSLEVDTY